MAVSARNYNRVIDLTLYTSDNKMVAIKCPEHGRKPAIEINGTFYDNGTLPAFNVTIKNLYLDIKDQNYTRLRVKAGYVDGTKNTFEGSIMSLYQESPGPEGQTVIQCYLGQFQNWLDKSIDLNYDAGAQLETILNDIQATLGASGVRMGQYKAKYLQLKDRFEWNGTARGALNKLQQDLADSQLNVFIRNNYICAICAPGSDYINAHDLEYLSAPPQENVGGEDGAYYTTVTAPWNPELQIGDILRIPSKVYIRNLVQVGGSKKTQTIQVTKIQFQFATTGSANNMTVQGFNVSGGN